MDLKSILGGVVSNAIWWLLSLFALAVLFVVRRYSAGNNKKAFRRWCETNIELASKYGFTNGPQSSQKVWEQFFEKGRIILSVINDWTLVFYGEQRTFKRLRNPEAIITGGPHNETINDTYLNELLQRVTDKEDRDIYQELSRTRRVVGGIGTIFIRDNLLRYLGKPLGAEFRSEEVLRVQGNGAELLVGVPHQNGSSFKAVLLLEEEGARFSKFEWQGT